MHPEAISEEIMSEMYEEVKKLMSDGKKPVY